MAKGLTKRQEDILLFIKDYAREEGYPPSIREIGAHFGIGSLRGVTVHLDALNRKGYISRSNTPRSIKIVHPEHTQASNTVFLPLLGTIAAGVPIFAQENVDERVEVPREKVKGVKDAFLLRIKGDSMINDGIIEGDLVIIKPQKTFTDKELVAVRIEDSATLKRVEVSPSGTRLLASNPAYSPIPIETEDAEVIGKVIGLIREF